MVALTQFQIEKRGRATLWVTRLCADPAFADVLADLDRLFERTTCRVIKDQRKIKVGRITIKIAGEERALYVKRYNAFSLRYRIFSLIGPSGAVRSLRGACVLAEAGIPTAAPLAAVEERFFGMLEKSFFVSEEIAGGRTADAYWAEQLADCSGAQGFRRRRTFLQLLASLFRTLHGGEIYHNDLKDANIIAVASSNDGAVKFCLLDLDGVQRCRRLGHRRRVKNIVQIYRTLGTHLSRSQQLFFLKCYLSASYDDGERKRDLIRIILKRARRIDAVKSRLPDTANRAMG